MQITVREGAILNVFPSCDRQCLWDMRSTGSLSIQGGGSVTISCDAVIGSDARINTTTSNDQLVFRGYVNLDGQVWSAHGLLVLSSCDTVPLMALSSLSTLFPGSVFGVVSIVLGDLVCFCFMV